MPTAKILQCPNFFQKSFASLDFVRIILQHKQLAAKLDFLGVVVRFPFVAIDHRGAEFAQSRYQIVHLPLTDPKPLGERSRFAGSFAADKAVEAFERLEGFKEFVRHAGSNFGYYNANRLGFFF